MGGIVRGDVVESTDVMVPSTPTPAPEPEPEKKPDEKPDEKKVSN